MRDLDTIRRVAAVAVCAAVAAGPACAETAADYPSRPITIVVGYPPGGATDVMARVVAEKLSLAWGQPVVVENKPGAGSNIATEQVVRAAPDGYTLLVEAIANATNMSVYRNLRYDSMRDLAPIVHLMSSPSVLVVSPKTDIKDVKSLIELARAKPGQVSYASSGVGGSPHLAGAMLELRTGVKMLHVPYKGAGPALTDVVGGTVLSGFKTLLGALPAIQSGQLRPLAVAGPKRLPELPDVPTMAEAGVPDFEVSSWNGLAAPAGTPAPIIDKINEEVNRILALPDVQEKMKSLGAQPGGGTPQAFAAYVQSEIDKWREVVQAAGVSL